MLRIMLYFVVLAGLILNTHGITPNRNGRWFGQETHTVTKVIRERKVVTEPTPSSCVVVQTSLPPCRHLRSISPSRVQQIVPTQLPLANNGWRPIIHPSANIGFRGKSNERLTSTATPPITPTTSGTWGWNIFNLGARDVTITKTIQDVVTSKYMDPNTVVTFSVKGCRPSRLPFDLPECQPPTSPLPPIKMEITSSPTEKLPVITEKGVIVMAPIQFISSMDPPVSIPPVKQDKQKVVESEKVIEKPKESLNALMNQTEASKPV